MTKENREDLEHLLELLDILGEQEVHLYDHTGKLGTSPGDRRTISEYAIFHNAKLVLQKVISGKDFKEFYKIP